MTGLSPQLESGAAILAMLAALAVVPGLGAAKVVAQLTLWLAFIIDLAMTVAAFWNSALHDFVRILGAHG